MAYKLLLLLLMLPCIALASNSYKYDSSSSVSSYDYLFKDKGPKTERGTKNIVETDGNIDIGIGTDCGKIDFKKQLNFEALKYMSNEYLKDVSSAALGALPMFWLCNNPYSKGACETLKDLRINASLASLFSINHCKAIDKFTTGKVAEFYERRSECINKEMNNGAGDWQMAMNFCRSKANKLKWSGKAKKRNELLKDSSIWAGYGQEKTEKILSFLRPLIGEVIIDNSKMKVDYGNNKVLLGPSEVFRNSVEDANKQFCTGIVSKLNKITNRAISRKVHALKYNYFVPLHVLDKLRSIPRGERGQMCKTLVLAIEYLKFQTSMEEAKAFLYKIRQNPNLGSFARTEMDSKVKFFNERLRDSSSIYSRNIPTVELANQLIVKNGSLYEGKNLKNYKSLDTSDNIFLICDSDPTCGGE